MERFKQTLRAWLGLDEPYLQRARLARLENLVGILTVQLEDLKAAERCRKITMSEPLTFQELSYISDKHVQGILASQDG